MLASSDFVLADILARCRTGDPTGPPALYARFARPMLLVCLRYVRVPEEAQDVLLDAFVKVFTHLDAYRADGPFEAWLRRIVVSTSLDAVRRLRQIRVQESVDDYHHLPAPDASVLDRLTLDEVRGLIDRLPEGARLVLLLYTVEGYAHAEIGRMLGCSESSSKAQLTRARQRLGLLGQAELRERGQPAPAGPAPSRLPADTPFTAGLSPVASSDSLPAARPFPLLTNLLFQ